MPSQEFIYYKKLLTKTRNFCWKTLRKVISCFTVNHRMIQRTVFFNCRKCRANGLKDLFFLLFVAYNTNMVEVTPFWYLNDPYYFLINNKCIVKYQLYFQYFVLNLEFMGNCDSDFAHKNDYSFFENHHR